MIHFWEFKFRVAVTLKSKQAVIGLEWYASALSLIISYVEMVKSGALRPGPVISGSERVTSLAQYQAE